MTKLGHMVFKGDNGVYNDKIRWCDLEGVNWVHNDKIGSNGLEMNQLGTQW